MPFKSQAQRRVDLYTNLPQTSAAVGTGRHPAAAVPTAEAPSEQAETPATQPAEEVETQVEDDASEVVDKGIYALQNETAERTVSNLKLWGQSGVWR